MDQAEAIQDDFEPEEAIESQEEVETTDEIEETEDQPEAESDEPEIEYVEIERNGVVYEVPKELEAELMRHADYTQKTQEVSEQRKSIETEREALKEEVQRFQQAVQHQQQNIQGHAQLAAIQHQLAQYQNVDWNAASQEDPQAAQQAFFQYSQLKDAATNLSTQLERQQAETLQQQRELHAKQLEQGKAELARDIPGWNEELATQIISHGESYGFSGEELRSVADPRMVKVLNDARLYRQSLKKATQAPKAEIKPVTKVKGKSNPKADPSKMSMDEYMKWRSKNKS